MMTITLFNNDEDDYSDLDEEDDEGAPPAASAPALPFPAASEEGDRVPKDDNTSTTAAINNNNSSSSSSESRAVLKVDYVSLAAILQETLARELNAKRPGKVTRSGGGRTDIDRASLPSTAVTPGLPGVDIKPTVKAVLYAEAVGDDAKLLEEHEKLKVELTAAFAMQHQESKERGKYHGNHREEDQEGGRNDDEGGPPKKGRQEKEEKEKEKKGEPLTWLGSTQLYYRRLERMSEAEKGPQLGIDGPTPRPPA